MTFLRSLPMLLALSSLPAYADDTVVFAADEADVQAFDKLLSDQQQKEKAANAPFGQAVKQEAQSLSKSHAAGNAMGAWVRDQRRNGVGDNSGNGSSSDASPAGQSGEAKGIAAEKSNGNSAFGHGHKK